MDRLIHVNNLKIFQRQGCLWTLSEASMDRRREELIVDGLHILHVLYNHECDLEGDGIIKYTKI